MTIYPAIDIKGGTCVRLMQGLADRKTEYFKDPLIPALRFRDAGAKWVHVVDLDGAFTGQPANLDAIRKICATGLNVQMGGGIRSLDDIRRILDLGVKRFVIGTRACESKDFVAEIARCWPAEAVIGIDARDGKAAIHGWVDVTDITAIDLAKSAAELGIRHVIYTDISTDGMMTGPNFEGHKELWRATEGMSVRYIASGGVHDKHDVVYYKSLSERFPQLEGVIVGKALYEGSVDLEDLLEIASS